MPATALLDATAFGTLSYNGHTFSNYARTEVSCTPHWDEASRTITDWEWVFDIHDLMVHRTDDAVTTDTEAATIKQLLTEPGMALRYQNRGLGDFNVNTTGQPGAVRDVAFGPKPELISWKPLGAGKAWWIHWRVTTRIPLCFGATVYNFTLMAVNYEVDYDIDEDGYTTVGITGYAEIPMSLGGGKSLSDDVDRYWENVAQEVPLGFKLKANRRHLSKDKRRLDFTFSWEELPSALPADVTQCSISHTVESSLAIGFATWNISYSGSITLAAGVPKAIAILRFLAIVLSRVRPYLNDGVTTFLLEHLSIEDDIFGRATSFQVRYRMMGKDGANAISLHNILQRSGLWEPIDSTNFALWKSTLSQSAFHPRGYAKFNHLPGNDVVIDLCQAGLTSQFTQANSAPPNQIRSLRPDYSIVGSLHENSSWFDYDCGIMHEAERNEARQKPIKGSESQRRQSDPSHNPGPQGAPPLTIDPSTGKPSRSGGHSIGPMPPETSAVPDVIQKVAQTTYTVALVGHATRLGFRVRPPELVTIGGAKLVESYRWVLADQQIGAIAGVPVLRTDWYIEYMGETPPVSRVEQMANPDFISPGA